MNYERIIQRLKDAHDARVKETGQGRLWDSTDSIFITRQLNQLRAKILEKKYPELKARSFVPLANDIAEGAETFTMIVYDEVGMAEIIASDADDIPMIEVKGTEIVGRIQYIASAYGWNFFEMIKAAFAGVGLSSRKAMAMKRAMARAEDDILATGGTPGKPASVTGLTGFVNNPNVGDFTFLHTPWDDTGSPVTAEEIVEDLNGWVSAMIVASKGFFVPDSMALPIYWFEYLSRRIYSEYTAESVLSVFLKNNPHIKRIDSWYVLDTADAGDPMGVVYQMDDEVLEAIVPMNYRELPPETTGFRTKIIAVQSCGGVVVHHPLGMSYGPLPMA